MQTLDFAPMSAYRHGACSRCHSTEGLVDIDVMIEYEGNIALCRGCIGEAALVAGFLVTEDGARRLAEAEAWGAAAEARAEDAEKTLRALGSTLTRMQNLKGSK